MHTIRLAQIDLTILETLEILGDYSHIELIWASPRELYNVVQADSIGCHIITATNNILKKLPAKRIKIF